MSFYIYIYILMKFLGIEIFLIPWQFFFLLIKQYLFIIIAELWIQKRSSEKVNTKHFCNFIGVRYLRLVSLKHLTYLCGSRKKEHMSHMGLLKFKSATPANKYYGWAGSYHMGYIFVCSDSLTVAWKYNVICIFFNYYK